MAHQCPDLPRPPRRSAGWSHLGNPAQRSLTGTRSTSARVQRDRRDVLICRRAGIRANCHRPDADDLAYSRHMLMVLSTGMSGTGKPTALQVLGSRGHRTVDTDTDRWSHWMTLATDGPTGYGASRPSGVRGCRRKPCRPDEGTPSRGAHLQPRAALERRPNVLSPFPCGWVGCGERESLGR